MAFSYFWHQFHLRGYQIAATFFFLLLAAICQPVQAQKKIEKINLSNHDAKSMHYGFHLSANLAKFKLEHSQYFVDSVYKPDGSTLFSQGTPGFNIGFVLNKKITHYVDLRFLPGVGFYSRRLNFKNGEGEESTQEFGITAAEFPLLVKLKSERRKNVRVYVVGGAKASINVGNKKKGDAATQLEINSNDFAIEYGVGVDLFYPFFKFAPELRFSNGLTNLRSPGNNLGAKSLDRVTTNTVTLYLFFEN
ncbi:PorT family protein [Adhaeribacter arboris]|uniref:PorT family protein n=1 Tax=Adhaeribacter arboris TaxID=2072846 RepID=A0A2T2YCW5_9BACT|nr:porin family protein [Adhaeribacter arboris]PSR53355.1 PorT family protein [Adhaeribacter arboris]